MDERLSEHPQHSAGFPSHDATYRIGSQVHDHEARIRLLERDAVAIIENMRHLTNALDDLQSSSESAQSRTEVKLDQIDSRLSSHVVEEAGSVRRLFASSIAQLVAVLSGIIYIVVEKVT